MRAVARSQHQHRAGQVLGQARRGAQPAGGGLAVADARRACRRAPSVVFDGRRDARRARRSTARRAPTSARRARVASSSTSCARAPASASARASRAATTFPTAAGLASSALGVRRARRSRRRARPASARRIASCRSWRAAAPARRRARSSAASSRCTAASAPTARTPFAEPIVTDWDVRLVIARDHAGPEGDAVARTACDTRRKPRRTTMPGSRCRPAICATARDAIARRDLEALGEVTEASCLSMHASAMAARPAVVYFVGATIEGYRTIQELRRAGVPAWFTCDAGPHVKALTDAANARSVEAALARLGKTVDLPARPARGGARIERARCNLSHGRAPGKAILSGEYAVLHGAPAIAVAVDRDVVAREGGRRRRSRRSCARAKEYAGEERRRAARQRARRLVRALRERREARARLVGRGHHRRRRASSLAKAERTLDPRAVFAIADAAHAEAQGTRGSGVDVACSVYGGAIRFVRKNGDVDVRSVDLPDGVRVTFIWAGQPASTAKMIERVKALAESSPSRHEAAIRSLVSHAHAFASAVTANDPAGSSAPPTPTAGDGRARRRRRLRDRHAVRTRSWPRSRVDTAARPSRRAPAAATSASPSPSATTPTAAAARRRCARPVSPCSRSALRRRACDWRTHDPPLVSHPRVLQAVAR